MENICKIFTNLGQNCARTLTLRELKKSCRKFCIFTKYHLVQFSFTREELGDVRIGSVHKMVEILDEDVLERVDISYSEHGLAQQEPAVVVLLRKPLIVPLHQVEDVLLAKEKLLEGGGVIVYTGTFSEARS